MASGAAYSLSPSAVKKAIIISLAVLFLVLIIFHPGPKKNLLQVFVHNGWIVKDSSLLQFLKEYIRKDLPTGIQNQFAILGKNHNGVQLFIVEDSSGKGGLEPFNANYDQVLDAVFIDVKLVRLAKNSAWAAGGRTLLSFVLLHELGHRILHRHLTETNDIIGKSSNTLVSWIDRMKKKLFSSEGGDERARKREQEADRWAVDQYLE